MRACVLALAGLLSMTLLGKGVAHGGNATFSVGYIGLGKTSERASYLFHIIPWAAKIALDEGYLRVAVPSWKDFTVEVLSYPREAPGTQSTHEQTKAVLPEVFSSNKGEYVHAVVSEMYEAPTHLIGAYAAGSEVPHVHINSANMLSLRELYPYSLRTVSSSGSAGNAMAKVCGYFKWLRISVLRMPHRAQADDFLAGFAAEMLKGSYQAVVTSLELPNSMVVWNLETDDEVGVTNYIVDHVAEIETWVRTVVAASEPRIFVLLSAGTTSFSSMLVYFVKSMLVGRGYVWMLFDVTSVFFVDAGRGGVIPLNPAYNPNSTFWKMSWDTLLTDMRGSLVLGVLARGDYYYGADWKGLWGNMSVAKLRAAGGYAKDLPYVSAKPFTSSARAFFEYWSQKNFVWQLQLDL